MKFTKFGKALLLSALSAGVILGVTSCIESYATGYLYVTGTVTAQAGGNGIISGFSIDHNTGKLTPIHGLPISSGGANPVRAVLITGSRFLFVLNRGVNAAGNGDCTTADPCTGSNITEYAVGGNGILTAQETFYTQGINPFRLIADTSGEYLYVLDHDSPVTLADGTEVPSSSTNPNSNCGLALGNSATTCGDITAFKIDSTTGRLQLIVNAQVTAANGAALPYFPIPSNPVDFVEASSSFITLFGTSAAASYPYTGGSSVFPYTFSSTNGQLTISQNSSQPLTDGSPSGVPSAEAIVYAGGVLYVLDNNPTTIDFNGTSTPALSQILPYSVGGGGALQAEPGGIVPDDPTLSNPITLLLESKGKYLYVANQGNDTTGPEADSGYAGYFLNTSGSYYLSFISGEPFGSGSGPQCLVEDPSDQFIYSADSYDSSVTGRVIDPNSGELNNLRVASTYSLQGPATWCLIDGRTN
jgi:6-phosphogluconolactonase (cycloisomerase 2 family)